MFAPRLKSQEATVPIRVIISWALGWVLACTAAEAAVHKDSLAGVKFEIPFTAPRIYNSEQMAALMQRAQKGEPPQGVAYTSGVYSKQGVPFIVVWTQQNDRPVSRELADHFASGGANAQLAAIGLHDFSFQRQGLRGEGRLEERGSLKVKIALILLKDHISYVGFHYKKPGDLVLFNKIRASLAPSKRQALHYGSLPHEKRQAGQQPIWELLLLSAAGGLTGFLSMIFYRVMGGRFPGDGTKLADPACAPGTLNLGATPKLL